jgi:alpha-mannosidase
MAEDGSGHMIVRLYESQGRHGSCVLTADLPVKEVYETTMEEHLEGGRRIPVKEDQGQRQMLLEFEPFEIKTLRAFS